MNEEELYQKILPRIQAAAAAGAVPTPDLGTFGIWPDSARVFQLDREDGRCCLVGAFLLGQTAPPHQGFIRTAADLLEVPQGTVWMLEAGFEKRGREKAIEPAYLVGQRLRREFVK